MRKSISMITGWSVKPEKVLRDIFVSTTWNDRTGRSTIRLRTKSISGLTQSKPHTLRQGFDMGKIEIVAYMGSQDLVFCKDHERLITETKMVNIEGTRTKEAGS